MFQFASLPPLTLYVHLPWCVRKCPYCDFNSHALRDELPQAEYVAALLRDLEHDLPRVWGRPVHSVFLGGGTPSLFDPKWVEQLLSGIRARLPLAPGAEITLEANPGTTDLARFRGFRDAGVDRLSIGIQSFDDNKLAALGRIHGRAEALEAAAAARQAGFENANLDLMFGLPGQTLDEALADIDTAIGLAPTHLSVYQLTIEPNTAFAAAPPPNLPDDDALWDMQQAIQLRLAASGYAQYEVSAYARPGRECAHNLNYWRFGDYLGIGAGAHAKLTDPAGITRLWKAKHPATYLGAAGTVAAIGGESRVARADAPGEFMMNALRLTGGFDKTLFAERTGLPISRIADALGQARARGLLEDDLTRVRPTTLGQRFLNDLIALFL
jgi:oxygen-independent coproporphyrinogen-3 oxidase